MIPLFYFLFSSSPFQFPHCSGKTNELQLNNICNKFLMLWQHVQWDVSTVRGSPGLSACPIGFTLHPCGNVPKRTRPTGTHVLVRSSLLKHRPIVRDISLEWFAVGLLFHVAVFHRAVLQTAELQKTLAVFHHSVSTITISNKSLCSSKIRLKNKSWCQFSTMSSTTTCCSWLYSIAVLWLD